jgi:hypothetical protein
LEIFYSKLKRRQVSNTWNFLTASSNGDRFQILGIFLQQAQTATGFEASFKYFKKFQNSLQTRQV